ncbi:MAG: TrlF family AAA-like ATPase, partial [Hyphomicrobium sp.]
SGSDAHSVAAYGVFPNGRATWIKGAPDFRTLLQAKADPVSRCHIGGEPEQVRRQREHSTKYITSITIKPSTDAPPGESWFDQTVPVNSGLVAIIGNKGSGKSALADAIALAGNAHSERLSFLTSERFRRPPNRSGHYQATLTWLSGEADTVSLGSDYVPGKPERLRYLPQDYIEEICNSLDATVDSPFERALRQVIFLHLSTETRRQSEDLAAVIDRLDADVGEKLRHLRSELHALNRRIIALEQATAADTIAALEQQITLKQQEIDALLAPEVVPEPVLDDQGEKDQARVSQIRAALAEIDGADATATGAKSEQLARLTNIEELLRLLREFQTTVGRLAARINEVAQRVGLSGGDLVSYSVTNQQVEQLRNATVDEIASLTSLLESEESHSVPNRRKIAHDELTALLGRISGPHERYQAYLSAQRQLDALRTSLVGTPEIAGSLSSLRAQLDRARTALPQELNSLRLDRLSFAREIHAVIRGKGETLRGLFVPVQARIDQEDVASELGFEFAVAFSLETLESTFFTLINQRSRGRFMEKDEGLREFRAILSPYALATEAGALSFIKGIVDALDDGAAANIDRQLRKGVERIQVYDFLFGLSYIQPYFTLRLNGKELHLLSPGERGALLLMFYLLLDPDDTPLLIDQPEQNLDNETVFRVLVPCFKRARSRRQLIMVTHNPNLAVVCDADQVIRATFLREEEHVRYEAGPLEAPDIAKQAVDVLEGTLPAFRSRRQRYTYSGQS